MEKHPKCKATIAPTQLAPYHLGPYKDPPRIWGDLADKQT